MSAQLTLTSLVESAASPSPQNGRASEQSRSRKSIPMHQPRSESTGLEFPISETCEAQTSELFEESIYSPEVFPASRIPLPGTEEAQTMTVTSGRQCARLLNESGLLGCLVKTLLESSAWNSTECALIWKTSVFGSNRLLFRLAPLMPSTGGIGSGYWPMPRAGNPGSRKPGTGGKVLAEQVRLWPTPAARDWKSGQNEVVALFPTPDTGDHGPRAKNGNSQFHLVDVVGSRKLNPEFVEWLMGYPIGHTVLKDWVMPSSRKSPSKSSGQSPNNFPSRGASMPGRNNE